MQHATWSDILFHPFSLLIYISIISLYILKNAYLYYKKLINMNGVLYFYTENFFYCLPLAGFLLIFSLMGFLINSVATYEFQALNDKETNLCRILLILSVIIYLHGFAKSNCSIKIYILKILASIAIGLSVCFVVCISTSPMWFSVLKKYITNTYCTRIFFVISILITYMMFIEGIVSQNIIRKIFACVLFGITKITILTLSYIILDRVVLSYTDNILLINIIIAFFCSVLYFSIEFGNIKKIKEIYGSFRIPLYFTVYIVFLFLFFKLLNMCRII